MKLAFEGVLLLLLFGVTIFAIGIPAIKLFKLMLPHKRDSLKEAQERLEVARNEAAAARLNKETEKVYEEIYEEVLEDDTNERYKKL